MHIFQKYQNTLELELSKKKDMNTALYIHIIYVNNLSILSNSINLESEVMFFRINQCRPQCIMYEIGFIGCIHVNKRSI